MEILCKSNLTSYKCFDCGMNFGNKKTHYIRHLKTNKHLKNAKAANEKRNIIATIKETPTQNEMILQLLQKVTATIPENSTEEKLTHKDIFKRENSKVPLPKKTFDKYFSMSNIINHCDFVNIYKPSYEIIYDGIVKLLENTKASNIPVIICNKDSGSKGRIYYFEQGAKFEYQSVSKITERRIYQRLCSLLRKDVRSLFNPYLDEMWNDMPDDLKQYFNNTMCQEKKIFDAKAGLHKRVDSILWDDYVCINDFEENIKEEEDDESCKIAGCQCWNCYKEGYDQNRTMINLYKNHSFFNYQEEVFTFETEDMVTEVAGELIEYIERHKYFKTFMRYKKMRNVQKEIIWKETNDPLSYLKTIDSVARKLLTEITEIVFIDNIYQEIIEDLD